MKHEKTVLLGSTGSVGMSTDAVLREDKEIFEVCGLAAGHASDTFIEQIEEFRPAAVAVRDAAEAQSLLESERFRNSGVAALVMHGDEGLVRLASLPDVSKVMNALSGAAGIKPSLAAVENGKSLLLANKEALVAAGELITRAARENSGRIVPVDSEHSAIFQCLQGESLRTVDRLLITASGGPFFNHPDTHDITPAMALKHPKWNMGPKITVDSSTLMNKGLEIIEAMWLFDIPIDRIKVVIHPECIVHSMVEFSDGVTMAQMSTPDMKFPIRYALHYPDRAPTLSAKRLSLSDIGALNFFDPDFKRFPCLELAIDSARAGGLVPAMVSAADEIAVDAFLKEKIPFAAIPKVIESVLSRARANGMGSAAVTLDSICAADAEARAMAEEAALRLKDMPRRIVKSEPQPTAKETEPEQKLDTSNIGDTPIFLLDNRELLPKHIAIIMDGNGRWATSRGLPRTAGHKAGAERVEPILRLCRELGIPVLTIYAFSTENWQRPEKEVSAIMGLLNFFIDKKVEELRRNKVRLRFPGDPSRLPAPLRDKMRRATEATSEGYEFTLNICINYGGRDEIVNAMKSLMERESPESITADMISDCLYTSGMPDPDVVIRTGGDNRISNFLLWQIAYAEIFFHPKFWPDFEPDDLRDCLKDYLSRERRFGRVGEQQKLLLAGIQSPEDLKRIPADKLETLAKEIRDIVISRVSEAGGHLSANLGVVELTIALHRVFDSPNDKMIWDVGHQCYPHKLLTGRYKSFNALRTRNGLSGFPKRSESAHDCFDTGHGSTSISAALGMAVGRDLTGDDSHIIGICGDGAMCGGMVFEALNHAGDVKSNLIIILNDNSYSIAPVTGALSRSLSRIRISEAYVHAHGRMERLKENRSRLFGLLSRLTKSTRGFGKYLAFKKGIVFEELGIKYVGPIDGHNIAELTEVLDKVRKINGPVLLHVLTQKGRGYEPAESDPATYHGVNDLKPIVEAEKIDILPAATFTDAFSATLERLAEKDSRIAGITAAMPSGTGLEKLLQKYPDRFFDVGMAEQHAVTFAAGLAMQGLRPVVAVYSTFLQRAYDQIFHDVCLQDLPVIFAIDRAGLVSKYGQTHQGLNDIAFLRHLPNIIMLAPRDTVELETMLEYTLALQHPIAIRYPSGADAGAIKAGARTPIEFATAEILCDGTDIAIWAAGPMAGEALKAARILRKSNISARVINARFIQPMDEDTLLKCHADGIRRFATVEDHIVAGGFGSLFLESINRLGIDTAPVITIGVPHSLIPDDSRSSLLREYGLTADAIAQRILDALDVEHPADSGAGDLK